MRIAFMRINRVLAILIALTCLLPARAHAQTAPQRPEGAAPAPTPTPTPIRPEQPDIDALISVVDKAVAGQAAPSGIGLTWESSDFLKGQKDATFIPFTVAIDRSALPGADAVMYVRVVNKGVDTPPATSAAGADAKPPATARPTYPWENVHVLQIPADGNVSRAIQVPAGHYDMFVAVKAKSGGSAAPATAVGWLRHDLIVPDFAKAELTTSSVILASAVQPVTGTATPETQDNPYVFGQMRIVPSFDTRFSKASNLSVVFWIYGAKEASAGKPDVQVDYNFYQRTADGEKYFNKTPPQVLGASTLPADFNLAAGHQLTASQTVPLASFPPGEYRLEITIADKTTGVSTKQNVNFTVAA